MRDITSHIDTYGWHVSGIEPGELNAGWAYTIGLSETFGHPELIVTAICCFPCAHSTLNGIGDLIAKGARFAVGEEAVSEDGSARARFGAVHPRQWQTNLFNGWLQYYDGKPWAPEPAALQVITHSRRGRWQDDAANRRWRLQRLSRAPHLAGTRRR